MISSNASGADNDMSHRWRMTEKGAARGFLSLDSSAQRI
jgi:hypothetical protein